MAGPQDSLPAQKRSDGKVVLWIVLATLGALAMLAVIVMGMMLAIGLMVFDRGTAETATTGGSEADTVLVAEEAAVMPVSATPRTDAEAAELLLSFSDAWRTANWDQMATFASADVIATARQWYSEDGSPAIDKDRLEFIFETCNVDGAGATSCTVLYAPPEGFGLLFTAVYADNGSGLTMTQLTFAGDAG